MTKFGRFYWRYGVIVLVVVIALWSINVVAQETEEAGDIMQNPVITANFPDPFILKVEDEYFAYSTNSNTRNVPLYRSTDLVNWEFARDVMPALASWVTLNESNVWAPEVLAVGDQYLLYYTAHDSTSNRQCIGVATSDSPEGPFRDQSDTPFICQVRQGGSIDPSPFRDEDGTLYLCFICIGRTMATAV
jgi:beta-xylosidase